MKIKVLILSILLYSCFQSVVLHSQNPIVQTSYTPDPAPMVYNDTLWVYTGNDADNADNFDMNKWQVFSTVDMVNWTDHGAPLAYTDFSWTTPKSAWAAQCIERNGKFYWYVCCEYPGKWHAIAVAVADRPTGPFKDVLGKPLVYTGMLGDIDPSVYIDDDGQAYLYWGNGKVCYIKLNEDMISYNEDFGIKTFDMTAEAFGAWNRDSGSSHNTAYEEGPWLDKRNGIYYLMYSAGGIPEYIAYSTGPSFNGPWTYQGAIMKTGYDKLAFTNHAGVVDYKGKSYFFYHNQAVSNHGFRRSTCVEEFAYNPDGSFPDIKPTQAGVTPIATLNPYKRTEGETIAWSVGLKTQKSENVGMYVTNINNADYIKVREVDFGTTGASLFCANVACGSNGGEIELRIDGINGTIIGSLPVSYTGGWDEWMLKSTNINNVTGKHDLYLVFKGKGTEELFNIDYWIFSEKTTPKKLVAINASLDRYKIDKISNYNTANYKVTALFSDGTKDDVTSLAQLSVSQDGIVEMNNGTLTGINYGGIDITASYSGKSEIMKIIVRDKDTELIVDKLLVNIDENISLLRGTSSDGLNVIAEFKYGNTLNVTSLADYSVSNPLVIKVEDGKIVSLKDGESTVSIKYKGSLGAPVTYDIHVSVKTFPLTVSTGFKPNIWTEGSINEETLELKTGPYGFVGWEYKNGINISEYKYLIVELAKRQNSDVEFKFFDENSYWSASTTHKFGNSTKLIIDLQSLNKEKDGQLVKCNPAHIYIMGFWSNGSNSFFLKHIFFSNDGENPVSGIGEITDEIEDENALVNVYTITGIKVRSLVKRAEALNDLSPGIYIIGNKKFMVLN